MKQGALYIGTSGWMYKDWGEMFYPKNMKKGHLQFLAAEFNTVEVNSSFYHLPLKSTFAKWHSDTPKGFVFSVKMSRYLTHRKRLKGAREPLNNFLSRAKAMEEKLGIVLIQLPPYLKYDKKLLESFLKSLSAVCKKQKMNPRFALEPRHPSWMDNGKEVRTLLKKFKRMCLVFPHSSKIPSFAPEKENVVTDFAYVRFHGPSEFAASRYGAARLRPWAERIKKWRAKGLTTFVYFNNDIHGHAIVDARTLKKLIS
jgi:uncharacterized protein YecE (DUF72 family)